MRTVYWAWSMVSSLPSCLQIGFAGYGAFYAANKVDDGTVDRGQASWTASACTPGSAIWSCSLVLIFLLIGFAARIGKSRIIRNGVLVRSCSSCR